MRVMLLDGIRGSENPLLLTEKPVPEPGDKDILIEIYACGICRTELDEITGRLIAPSYPVIPGHQAVGLVVKTGKDVKNFREGDWAAVGWIFSACGKCSYCLRWYENLCPEFRSTGLSDDGGYAEFMKINENFAHHIPEDLVKGDPLDRAAHIAPLICGGAIGYRALRASGICDGSTLGLSGFGSSASIVMKIVRHLFPGTKVFVFARDEAERNFAMELGAAWSGNFGDNCPDGMDAVIDTTPAWGPVVEMLRQLKPGGSLIINAIRKIDSDREALMRLDYAKHLWMEKVIKSVANVTRRDIDGFLETAASAGIEPEITVYPLEEANRALRELGSGGIRGSKVLVIKS